MFCIAFTFLRAENIFVAVQRVQLRFTHAMTIIRDNKNAIILMAAYGKSDYTSCWIMDNAIAVARNGGWRYGYGNMFYVELVSQYLTVSQVSGELAQKIMNEALKYQGWDYVYGGSNPNTSFDCSGLVQWCYGKAGISLPRTAQAQYDATQHIPLSQAQAGDLVFFHSTYNAGTYVTHVGIYVGNNQMYHAGDPIGYADLTSSYWQQHLIGAGRIKQ